ncbi:MAG TPA: sporulation inhibitor of replication protein SirA [Bacillota bacterium]|nr:sporulation inhibitor of replication protein SirA [Bacillota bacterium]
MNVLEVYYVYSMKTKAAHHFYYKSDLLYHFLKNYNEQREEKELTNQFSYVTTRLETGKVMELLKKISSNVQINEIQANYFQITNGMKSVYLHVLETHLKLKCPSIYDAEQLLFKPLRLYPTHLFVAHAKKQVYGWISTLKNEQVLNSGQTL